MYICIEGNIGAGKTTLAKALAKKMKADFLGERFEENTLLPLFYNDKDTFAFPTEYSFLIDRQKQLVTYFNQIPKGTITVSDFHFDKCLCFGKANLSRKDFKFFQKHFHAIRNTIQTPNLVVYLDTSIDLLMRNIENRGRDVEKNLKKSYLSTLNKSLNKYYLKDGEINTLVLILTIKEYNFTTLNVCCDEIIKLVNTLK